MSQVAGVLFCFASGAQAQLPGTVSAYDDAYKSNISKDGGIKSCIGAPKKYKEAFSDFKKKFKITINRPNNIEAPEGERQVYGLLKSLEGNPMTEKYLKGLKISFVDTLENKKSNCGTAGVYKGGGVIHIPRYEPDVCKKDQSAPRKKIPFSISTLAHEVGHHLAAADGGEVGADGVLGVRVARAVRRMGVDLHAVARRQHHHLVDVRGRAQPRQRLPHVAGGDSEPFAHLDGGGAVGEPYDDQVLSLRLL